ncbi:hypothetical protein CPB83DRAFT_856046 [Crepidotus variabilis]|uniref:Uncharacterized protein n=1 Tax=Crepidotus variabilis TaxID=179855 RepID=A0A9P6JPA0_9AGAR|nr:hypothetical protein CPB83DRAFT_856046 [Crepidotus variabilis]
MTSEFHPRVPTTASLQLRHTPSMGITNYQPFIITETPTKLFSGFHSGLPRCSKWQVPLHSRASFPFFSQQTHPPTIPTTTFPTTTLSSTRTISVPSLAASSFSFSCSRFYSPNRRRTTQKKNNLVLEANPFDVQTNHGVSLLCKVELSDYPAVTQTPR